MGETNRILHFTIGNRRFGLKVAEIMEIREIQRPMPVPRSPDVIAGVTDIRGQVVTLIDLGRIYGMPSDGIGGWLAVQLASPLEHLGIMIRGRVENLETDPGADALTEEATEPSVRADAGDAFRRNVPDAEAGALGREIVVEGARPTYLLDTKALVEHCTRCVRERFRVAQ